jgi:outer membrane receptor for ferrienterochelin and colicins
MRNLRQIAVRLRSAPLLALVILAASRAANAQTATGTVLVRVMADSFPVAGATIAAGTASGATDRSGLLLFKLPTGRRTFHVASTGFLPESLAVNVGAGMNRVTVALHHRDKVATQDRVVTQDRVATPDKVVPQNKVTAPERAAPQERFAPATRIAPQAAPESKAAPQNKVVLPDGLVADRRDTRKGVDEPTNVEVAGRDAVEEQIDRSPGNIAELLDRMGGVRVTPLLAGSAGAAIRIRGMPGHYTKILEDGLPLFGTTPQGLEPLQIPALDVQRVEVIPGVTSALYGPTALGGIVNVVSAPPTSPSEVVMNGTSREASDVALWQTHTFSPQLGASFVAGRHYQNPADLDRDGWTELTGYKRIVARPRVYWSPSEQSSWFLTGGWMSENRRSGTFGNARLPDFNRFSDDDDTRRADGGVVGRMLLDPTLFLTVRASLTREWRTRWFGDTYEHDRRNTIFGDAALTKSIGDNNVLVGGMAFERDQFVTPDTRDFSYRYTTPALFAEHTWTPQRWIGITSSARLDLQSEFGDFVSPRISVVLRPSETWTARISRANGVYAPTPLTDETETFGLSPLRAAPREAEHALGWSLDVSHVAGALELRGSAYRTIVDHPLVLRAIAGSGEDPQLVTGDEPLRTQGVDVAMQYRAEPLRFTATYAYLDATRPEIGEIVGVDFSVDTTMTRPVPLNPRHAVKLDAAYERENDKSVGIEVHFTGKMALSDTLYSASRPYVTLDAHLEKHIARAILFVRGKNLTGVRQSQYAPVLLSASGPAGQWSREVWAPLDGFVLNAGLRFKY